MAVSTEFDIALTKGEASTMVSNFVNAIIAALSMFKSLEVLSNGMEFEVPRPELTHLVDNARNMLGVGDLEERYPQRLRTIMKFLVASLSEKQQALTRSTGFGTGGEHWSTGADESTLLEKYQETLLKADKKVILDHVSAVTEARPQKLKPHYSMTFFANWTLRDLNLHVCALILLLTLSSDMNVQGAGGHLSPLERALASLARS